MRDSILKGDGTQDFECCQELSKTLYGHMLAIHNRLLSVGVESCCVLVKEECKTLIFKAGFLDVDVSLRELINGYMTEQESISETHEGCRECKFYKTYNTQPMRTHDCSRYSFSFLVGWFACDFNADNSLDFKKKFKISPLVGLRL